MAQAKIYLVEPVEQDRLALRQTLIDNGYEVECFDNATELICAVKLKAPSVILLNVYLNDMITGIDACKMIRDEQQLKLTPIFLISDRDDVMDRVLGLEMGADDFMTKPFSKRELVARVKAHLRKLALVEEMGQNRDIITVKDLTIDHTKREVTRNGEVINLTYKEFELLYILAVHKGQVLTRDSLLDKVWGYSYYGETRTVDAHIRNLRKLLSDDEKKYIATVRGVGYKLRTN